MNIRFNAEATEALKAFAAQQPNKVIKLKVLSRGWGKPALGLALEEQKEKDIVRTIEGITFAIDSKEELELKNVEILHSPYYINHGFYVKTFSGRK